jgi:hypothetical protein
VYDHSEETSFEKLNAQGELFYGTAYARGYFATDLVCTLKDVNSCAPIDMLIMTYQEGFKGISGIVGMSTGLYGNSAPLLIEELFYDGKISEPVFGFYLGSTHEESFLDIGFISESAMRDPSELVWLPVVNNDFWWTNFITGISFTTPQQTKPLSVSLPRTLAMTDTGTSCTYFPSLYFKEIIGILKELESSWYRDDYGDIGIPCDQIN